MHVHTRSAVLRSSVVAAIVGTLASCALAQWDPPAGYYTAATGTGATLRTQLNQIIGSNWWVPGSTSHVVRSYDSARQSLALLYRDPNNPSNLITIYTGISLPSIWDSGITWNREHTWPDSRGLGGSGMDYTDLMQLRPCEPGVNGSRGNEPFGAGNSSYWDPQPSTNPSVGQFVPGTNDRGEMARAMFYMDVRYDGADASTTDLVLVNGFPSGSQMGDLAQMLAWHYEDPVNDTERQRNHLIWSNIDNPLYYQGNRNPFVDRPEFVWALWGTSPNDSRLHVGAAPLADGSSTAVVNLRGITGSALSSVVTLTKSGTTPTTFNATLSGTGVNVTGLGQGQAFAYNPSSRQFTISPTSIASPVASTVTITIDNTDLTSSGAGRGSADANDVITVNLAVLSPSNPSWEVGTDVNSSVFDHDIETNTGVLAVSVPLHNFGFTTTRALLEIDSATGGAAPFSGATFTAAPIGSTPGQVMLSFDSTSAAPGPYSATYTIFTSDENIPGATASQVQLTWQVLVTAPPAPCLGDGNNDGIVSFDDVTAALTNFAASGPVPLLGDSNFDGEVTFDDVVTVLSNFSAVCP